MTQLNGDPDPDVNRAIVMSLRIFLEMGMPDPHTLREIAWGRDKGTQAFLAVIKMEVDEDESET